MINLTNYPDLLLYLNTNILSKQFLFKIYINLSLY